jgi:penicillin-binding protein 2
MAFAALLVAFFARAVQLELAHGASYRTEALRPVEKERSVPGVRGKISARDGTILACDKEISCVAVQYRYLQNPPDPKWLKATARARLSISERSKSSRVLEAQSRVLAERDELMHRLANLCKMTDAEWSARAQRIQSRVEKIAASANARQEQKEEEAFDAADESWSAWIARSLKEPQPPVKITVAEELDYHILCDDPPPKAIAEIESRRENLPGVKIVKRVRRFYPQGKSAGNVLGYMGLAEARNDECEMMNDECKTSDSTRLAATNDRLAATRRGASNIPRKKYHADDWLGKMGIEKSYETALRGRRGTAVDLAERGGRILSTSFRQEPEIGRDITLTLDSALQLSAEELLDSALDRRRLRHPEIESAGGAIVVMDISDGALRAMAAAPRFDPNLFASDRSGEIAALLDDPSRPLFDRAARMAIAPGSVFKVLVAAALLESGGVDPEEPFFCQGYLHRPEQQRCAIFVQQGIGHGETTLADALCVSCNVYFFHHAGKVGPDPLVDWAERFGFGRTTGVDLSGEAAGVVPNPENIERIEHHPWKIADTQSMAIGQGSLTATPLQIARMMAAIAGDGALVTPHVVESRTGFQPVTKGESNSQSVEKNNDRLETCPTKIPGLHEKTLKIIREGLERVVFDPAGTAHGSVYSEEVAIAGKTGTAETGDGPSHAWFAGYLPADKPKYAIVIALEHAGEAATAAGPVAKRLALRMKQLGMLE